MAVKKEGIEVLTGPTEKFPYILALGLDLVNFEEVLIARYAAAVLWRAASLSSLHKGGSVGFALGLDLLNADEVVPTVPEIIELTERQPFFQQGTEFDFPLILDRLLPQVIGMRYAIMSSIDGEFVQVGVGSSPWLPAECGARRAGTCHFLPIPAAR